MKELEALLEKGFEVSFYKQSSSIVEGFYAIDIQKDGFVLCNLFSDFKVLPDLMDPTMVKIAFKNGKELEEKKNDSK